MAEKNYIKEIRKQVNILSAAQKKLKTGQSYHKDVLDYDTSLSVIKELKSITKEFELNIKSRRRFTKTAISTNKRGIKPKIIYTKATRYTSDSKIDALELEINRLKSM